MLAKSKRNRPANQNLWPARRSILCTLRTRAGCRHANAEDMNCYAADTGFIAQNVYRYCASAGLNTVLRGLADREALGAALGLSPHQQIVLAQTLGYPK